MAIFDGNMPYSNFHELNLDWIITKVHDLTVEYVKTQNELKALEDDFVNLKNYVDNYFASTDFAQLADEVLHEMLNNGELTTLFAQYTLRVYTTVSEMKADTMLTNGMKTKTLGYYIVGDGGGADYIVSDTNTADEFYENLNNGLYAYLVKEPSINLLKVGIANNNDITEILQKACDKYNVIDIPKGTYYTLNTIHIRNSDVTLNGNGSVIEQKTSSNGQFLSCSGYNGFTLKDITLNYPTTPDSTNKPSAISIYESSKSKLENVTILKPWGIGISIENSSFCTVDNCDISYAQANCAGIWLGGGSRDCHIYNTRSNYNELDGIIVSGQRHIIENSVFNHNGTNPPASSGALGACGIYVETNSGTDCQYINNSCQYNTECGMDLKGYFINVIGNTCSYNGLSGICLRNFTWGAKVTNNVCRGNGQNPTTSNPSKWGKSGINTSERVQDTVIADNVCLGDGTYQDYGIKLLGGTNENVLITGNVCSFHTTGGINTSLSTAGNVVVTGNIGSQS